MVRSAPCVGGCLPVTLNSSFETKGRVESCTTGPRPLAGGMKKRIYAYHPTLEFGAKLGGDPPAAIAGTLKLPAR